MSVCANDDTGSMKEKLAAWLVRLQLRKDFENWRVQEHRKDLDPNLVDLSAPKVANGLPGRNPDPTPANKKDLKVGIVGAGIAGLYTAFLLDYLDIEYEILEANPKRVGGRLYTHRFSNEPHDYYDIGAMRYPDSPVMDRTFRLFAEAGIQDRLRTYFMSGPEQPTRYNDITRILPKPDPEITSQQKRRDAENMNPEQWTKQYGQEDPFKVSVTNRGPVPDTTVRYPDDILDNAYDYYREKIKRDPDTGFKYLINHDQFSLRDYLAFVEDQDPETIEWLETLNSATGWFGQAFTENVMESLAFEYDKSIDWWCIDGGTQKLVEAMKTLKDKKGNTIGSKIKLGHEVTAVSYDAKASGEHKMNVTVKVAGKIHHREYATVFNTTTLAALQRMDLRGLNLPYAAKTAIRTIHYDTSSKVGIKFSYPWWITDCGVKQGGLGKTDLPLRVCVYPSYNWDDVKPEDLPWTEKSGKPAVLLCSYSWGQDSERVASLIDNGPIESEEPPPDPSVYTKNGERLKELMFDNLAKLHTKTTGDAQKDQQVYDDLKKKISDAYITHHAYDWSKDEFSSSAFALFGPGDFRKLYSTLVRPLADSRFHIIGEAASAHHAWIVGALDSSLRGVHLFLERFGLRAEQEHLQTETFDYQRPGTDPKTKKPYPLDTKKLRFGKTGEIDYETAHLQVALGMIQNLPTDHVA